MLQGLDTPVILTLIPGQRFVDYRVNLRVPEIGLNANHVLGGLSATESPELLEVLNARPADSKSLMITGGGSDCQAWLIKGHLFLRTRLTVSFIAGMGFDDE